ncbi:MAG: AMP-binding protein [Acidimicrobiales bacterium]
MPQFARALAEVDPDGLALVEYGAGIGAEGRDRGIGWAEVDDALNRVANIVLDSDLGPDRRVAVFAENAIETALAHLGSLLGGASTVPVNFHLTAEEAAYILEDSAARILFVCPATAARGIEAARLAGVPTVVAWGGAPPGATDWTEWLATGSPEDPPGDVRPRPNLLYTSGTTGRPKGTELPPTMFAGGDTMTEHLEGLGRNRLADFGTHLVVGPMYHTGPLSGMRLLAAGTPSVILGKFDAETTLAAIERFRVETTVMVPTHFVRLLALPDEVRARYDLSSLKSCAHTGAMCPDEVKGAMIEWWGPVFRDAYGATEVGTVCSISSEEWLEHRGSVGRTIPPFSAHILDADLNELAANTEGLLFFRDATGRGIVYPNDPDKTAASNPEPGLFTLGEIGYIDDDGYVFITDRASDMVVSGGVNLYPAEPEQLLIDHPAVADVACIGVPHPEMGEELKALIVAEDPAAPPDVAELSSWLRNRLSHYKCPRSYEVVAELGRTTMGKINKRRLRDSYLSGELPRLDSANTNQISTNQATQNMRSVS